MTSQLITLNLEKETGADDVSDISPNGVHSSLNSKRSKKQLLEGKGFTKQYFKDNKYDHINEILEEQEIRELDLDEINTEKGFIDRLIISEGNTIYSSF